MLSDKSVLQWDGVEPWLRLLDCTLSLSVHGDLKGDLSSDLRHHLNCIL
jgi:hypothetical protein